MRQPTNADLAGRVETSPQNQRGADQQLPDQDELDPKGGDHDVFVDLVVEALGLVVGSLGVMRRQGPWGGGRGRTGRQRDRENHPRTGMVLTFKSQAFWAFSGFSPPVQPEGGGILGVLFPAWP